MWGIAPKTLKHPMLLLPCCVLSLSIGLLLFMFILFPCWYPLVSERMIERNMVISVFLIANLNVFLPVTLLYLAVKDEMINK